MKKLMVGAALAAVALCAAPGARAADQWWPVKVYDMDSGKPVETDYAPLPKAYKPWNVCVLFPHMKDTFWVAVDYGIVEEAKRMGINMTLYEAGGYENLPKQLSQFDDCMAGELRRDHRRPDFRGGAHAQDARGAEGRQAGDQHREPAAQGAGDGAHVRRLHADGRADRQVPRRLHEGQAGARW